MGRQFCGSPGLTAWLWNQKTRQELRFEVNKTLGNSLAYFMLDLGSAKSQKDCNGCGNIPTKLRGNQGLTRTYRSFRSSEIYRLIPRVRTGPEVAAFHCRHRADHRQFLGLPGVSRYPPLSTVFRERQSRRDGRSLGFKLGRFQRRNLAHRATGLRMVKTVMDAHERRQQREKSGIEKHSQTRSATISCAQEPSTRRLLKNSVAGCSKSSQRRGARKIDERRRTWRVRCSEAIERNEAYESFSAAC